MAVAKAKYLKSGLVVEAVLLQTVALEEELKVAHFRLPRPRRRLSKQ